MVTSLESRSAGNPGPSDARLVCFSYSSRALPYLQAEDLLGVLEASSANNGRLSLTGLLTFDGDRFWQVLEGPPAAISHIAAAIFADPRHCDIAVETWRLVRERNYRDWRVSGFPPDITGRVLTADEDANILHGRFGS